MKNLSQVISKLAVVAFIVTAASANASTLLTVSSYDMPNGDGTAHSGGADYWDTAYSNCSSSSCSTDGRSGGTLSGGKGLLTDGVIATESFGIGSGVGEYVGWLEDPTITFHFGSTQTITEMKLAVDNPAGVGGVGAPSKVVINGKSYSDSSWLSASGPEIIDIMGFALNSSDITVVLDRSTDAGNFWVFASEVQFFGPSTSETPLPATLPMMLGGMAGFGFLAYRQRHKTAVSAPVITSDTRRATISGPCA
jgi:hypothetical protein